MPLQYNVKPGDSLWGLAGRHLGNFSRWPELLDFHNDQVGKSGGNRGRIFRINDENLIFVGQILYLPIRDKQMLTTPKATGSRQQGAKTAVPIELKVEYGFGHDDKPFIYYQESHGGLIKCEMKGKIAIEIVSPDRYRHNLELLMAKDAMQCKQKLNAIYNPVFCALTAKPEMEAQDDKVILEIPISAKAGISPYSISVANDMSGSPSPQHVSGKIDMDGRKYRFSALIELRVNILKRQGLTTKLQRKLVDGVERAYDIFTDKDYQRKIGKSIGTAGKITTLTHAASALKAYALLDVASGGPVTTTAMMAAGTPAGQKVVIEFIPSMNPGTLPSPTLLGFLGWYAGSKLEKIAAER